MRSSHPRRPMKYSRFGLDAARFTAKSTRKTTQIRLSYTRRTSRVAAFSGRSRSTMMTSERTVRTSMKML